MKRALFLLVLLNLGWITLTPVQAVVYDVGDDWAPLGSAGPNPNGVWSYIASNDLTNDNDIFLSPYIEYNNGAGTPMNRSAYWGGAENLWPLIWHSFTYSDGSHAVGDTIMQAAYSANTGPKYAKIRWTAPEDGAVTVAVTFNDDYTHATGGNLHGWVVHNDTVLFGTTSLTTESCFVDVPVAAGDTIDFAVATSGIGEPLSATGNAIDVDAIIETLLPPTEPVECILWLDAAEGLADPNTGIPYGDGDVVKRWQDTQSGKAMKANLAWGGPTLETNEINGKNVIRFTGNDGLVIDPNSDPDDLLNAPNFTIYVVGRINDLTLSQIFYANYSDPAAGAGVGISDTRKNTVKYYTNYGGTLSPEYELVEGRYYLLSATRSWIGERTLFINGKLAASGSGKATYNVDTVASIGALDVGRQFLIGDIAEILIYNGVDPNETVTADLMSKYDIDPTPVVSDPNTISWTAMTLSRTNSVGAMDTLERWNTLYLAGDGDGIWDLALYEGDLITDPALYDPNNPGNFWLTNLTYMMIDIPLRLGEERTFNWHNARVQTDVCNMGINLFFDDSQYQNAPDISAYVEMDDTGSDNNNFHANSSISTLGWPSQSTPGAGTVIYYNLDKKMKITMTEFVVYHQDVYNLDFVGAQDQGEEKNIHTILGGNDGANDVIGRFTLKVETLDCSIIEHIAGDFNKDCYVDLEDFAVIIGNWLKCNDPQNAGCTDMP